jgi:predicted MFS family arabinose efflux permease
MPRVPRSSLVRLAATPDAVTTVAVDRLGATPGDAGVLEIAPPDNRQPAIALTLTLTADHDHTNVAIASSGTIDIPFFGWFFRPPVRIARRRARTHAAETLRCALAGEPMPMRPKPVVALPPVAFSADQSRLIATAAAATAVVTFGGALFGQLNSPISHAFHSSDAALGDATAITRAGALFALVAISLADRRGRRRSILIGVVGSAIACAISAVAPGLVVLTGAQLLQRAFVGTTGTVAFIAVVEEAPEGARAYAASMLALAGGFGFSLAVVMLPFGDLGHWGWRIPFALGAASIVFAPFIARNLMETTRYTALTARTDVLRGRMRDVFRNHRNRFILLAIVAFMTSAFSAPSSTFMNKYLTDVRGFSNTGIAVFRTITTGLPGLVGLLVGGRLAEARGRRPVAAVALAIATATQMVFFLTGGPVLWVMAATSIFMAGASGIALATLDAELFSTEVRSTSNALLLVIGVLGSATGLLLAGGLSDRLGGLGRSTALTGIGALVVALLVVPLLPEPAAHMLDEISPIHTVDPDG